MYDLHKLGWYSFQELSLTVAREVFGQSVMSFLSSGDGGRDGSFTGKWIANDKQTFDGQFVFQCKFSERPNYKLRFADISEELHKIESLVKKGLCDIYILITNAGVSGRVSEKIEISVKAQGAKYVIILGSTWLTQNIKESKKLRRLVPRLYGLGDLSQILDERIYSQGKVLLESLKEDLAKVVITSTYKKAAEALDKYGFVLLVGEPAAGKTTIASLLAMGALDQWQAPALKLDNADKVVLHWDPDDPAQFFWIDDAFGVTQYESTLVHQWNHCILQVKAMLRNGARIVMTSRDYIYNAARADLKEGAFPLFRESQVVIDLHELTLIEKRQILYNHLKMGKQSQAFRREIKPFLESVAESQRFVPETARRLASPIFTKSLLMYKWHVNEFVDKQESFLVDLLRGLDKDSLGALALIYVNADRLSSPIDLRRKQVQLLERLGSSLGGCTRALTAMKGSIIQLAASNDGYYWKFRHPTIGDAFSIYITQNPELIEIYLHGCPVDKLIEQISCGDMEIEKAILIPKQFYSLILKRLKTFTINKRYKSEVLSYWSAKDRLYEFLARRCSGEFLVKYIDTNPEILSKVANPGLYLDSVSEVGLAFTLHKFNLLPEETRKQFVKTVSGYAVNGEDAYALKSNKIRVIFTDMEYENLKNTIRINLIPTLESLTENRKNGFTGYDRDPDEFMQPLLEMYDILQEEFDGETDVIEVVRGEIDKAKDWIEENEKQTEIRAREILVDEAVRINENFERSIFDDVDL